MSTTFCATVPTGPTGPTGPAGAGTGAAGAFSGAASGAFFAAAASPPAPPADAPSLSTLKIVWPTFTLSPALTFTSATRPATDEGTSIVALSVSSSRTDCSFATVSPGLTRTRSTSPLVTFSPSSGSLKSVGTKNLHRRGRGGHGGLG